MRLGNVVKGLVDQKKKGGSGYGFPSRLQPNPTMKRGHRLT